MQTNEYTVKITPPNPKREANYKNQPLSFSISYLLQGETERNPEVICVRISQPGTVARCNVAIRLPEDYRSGRGNAGGGGYHKPSAAMEEALLNAGVQLVDGDGRSYPLAGWGESEMSTVVRMLGELLFPGKKGIIHTAR